MFSNHLNGACMPVFRKSGTPRGQEGARRAMRLAAALGVGKQNRLSYKLPLSDAWP